MSTYPKAMARMKASHAGRPAVHPMSEPRTRLPLLLNAVTNAPQGVGGVALLTAGGSMAPPQLCGPTLVRAAMAQHRARALESTLGSKKGSDEAAAALKAHPSWHPLMADGVALYHDERVVVLPDKFPKSAFHFLVIPRDTQRLKSLNGLGNDDRPLLRHMQSVGTALQTAIQASSCDQEEIFSYPEHYDIFTPSGINAVEQKREDELQAFLEKDSVLDRTRRHELTMPASMRTMPCTRVKFLMGFHSMPSLPPLHMHVLSLDLLSRCLKHKKHYNSFTTKFFLSAKDVDDDLAQFGTVGINQQVHIFEFEERRRLECVWCGLACDSSMNKLKRHLPVCHKNAALLSS